MHRQTDRQTDRDTQRERDGPRLRRGSSWQHREREGGAQWHTGQHRERERKAQWQTG
jgi:hypothetical protein